MKFLLHLHFFICGVFTSAFPSWNHRAADGGSQPNENPSAAGAQPAPQDPQLILSRYNTIRSSLSATYFGMSLICLFFFSLTISAVFRGWVHSRWKGESPRHSARLPSPPHAPADPTRTQSAPAGRGQADSGARGRPPVPAGLSTDPAAPQRGHHHRCFLNTFWVFPVHKPAFLNYLKVAVLQHPTFWPLVVLWASLALREPALPPSNSDQIKTVSVLC